MDSGLKRFLKDLNAHCVFILLNRFILLLSKFCTPPLSSIMLADSGFGVANYSYGIL